MTYKGYTATMEVDEDAGLIFGTVKGLRDIITFQGKTVAEGRKDFKGAIDFYLKLCADRGEEPDRPYSGKFNIRIDPALHRELAGLAESRATSLNALVEEAIADAVGNGSRP